MSQFQSSVTIPLDEYEKLKASFNALTNRETIILRWYGGQCYVDGADKVISALAREMKDMANRNAFLEDEYKKLTTKK